MTGDAPPPLSPPFPALCAHSRQREVPRMQWRACCSTLCVTTEMWHLDRLVEFEQESNTDSEQDASVLHRRHEKEASSCERQGLELTVSLQNCKPCTAVTPVACIWLIGRLAPRALALAP